MKKQTRKSTVEMARAKSCGLCNTVKSKALKDVFLNWMKRWKRWKFKTDSNLYRYIKEMAEVTKDMSKFLKLGLENDSRVNLSNRECVVKRCYTIVCDWPGMTRFVALASRQIPGIRKW